MVRSDELMLVVVTTGDAYVRAKTAFEAAYPEESYDRDGDGDFDLIDFGILRHNETLAAMSMIGVDQEDIVFMGYPDAGIDELWNDVGLLTSPFTLESKVPEAYDFAYRVGAPYTRDSLLSDIKKLISDFKPTLVYSPRTTDTVQDHWALGKFVAQALLETFSSGSWKAHLGYLVHWEANEPNWPHTSLDWTAPVNQAPPNLSLRLADFGFTPDDKRKLIDAYTSQVILSGPYLRNFAKTTEIFWVESFGPAYETADLLP